MLFVLGSAGKNLARIFRRPDTDNSRARRRFVEGRFHRDEAAFLEILKGVDEILWDFARPKLAHASDETFTFTFTFGQRFDFFDDLLRGHLSVLMGNFSRRRSLSLAESVRAFNLQLSYPLVFRPLTSDCLPPWHAVVSTKAAESTALP